MKVYDYLTARDFIIAAFAKTRSGNGLMTVERYAAKLGLGVSTLKMILSAQRKPTVHHVLSVARTLRLSLSETSYLETLVLKDAAKTSWETAYYTRLLAEKKKHVQLSNISTSDKELISESEVLPLLIYFMESKGQIDSTWLSKELNVSRQRVEELIGRFQKSEILQKRTVGDAFHVAFDKLTHRTLQKKFLQKVLLETIKKIDSEYEKPESLFVNYTFSATPQLLLELQIELKNLMEKYLALPPGDNNSLTVAQACFQVYPVIRAERS